MHLWDPLSPWFSTLDKFSPTTGGAPTPATIVPLLGEDHVNNHASLGVPPPNTDMRTPCQVEVTPCTSEGIEPFTLANSPPGQVEVLSSCPINSPLGQVGVTPRKSEGIEPFTTVNSPPCQVGVTPRNPGGIEPSTLVNSPPGQVEVSSSRPINSPSGQVGVTPCNLGGVEPSTLVNSPPGQVGAAPSHPINTPSGYRGVAAPVLSRVPVSVSSSVAPVSSLTSPTAVLVPITDPPCLVTHRLCPLSPDSPPTALNTTQATSHKQPVDLPVKSDHPRSAFIEEVDDEDLPVPSTGPQPIGDATVQHIDNSDIFDGPGPTSSSAPPSIKDPHEGLGASDSNDDSLPFLGDPEPEYLGEMTPPSISLIGAAAFKQLIDVGEEIYTINIQLTSDYLDIAAL